MGTPVATTHMVAVPVTLYDVGRGLTVITLDVEAVHPRAEETVTVNVPAVIMDIAAVVAPVLHTYVAPPLAVKVAVAPVHMMPSLGKVPDVSAMTIAGVGSGFTVINFDTLYTHTPFVMVAE